MATITTAGAGNWSSTTPDTPWPGGTLPSADDAVVINHAVTWDNNSIPRLPATTGTYLSISFGAAGQLICGAQTGVNALYATTITGGAIGSAGSIAYSGTACDSLTITCTNFNGCPSGGTVPHGLLKSSTKPLTINATAITGGGGGANASTVRITNATGTVTINSNIIGGTVTGNAALYVTVNATVNVTATSIKGGSGNNAYGIGNENVFTMTVAGNPICIIEGGTGTNSPGVTTTVYSTTITLTDCSFKDGTGTVAWIGKPPTWTPAASNYYQIAAGKLALEVAAGSLIASVVNGTVTGTYHEAAVAEVEAGVMFGPSSTYEGTLAAGGYTVNGVACA